MKSSANVRKTSGSVKRPLLGLQLLSSKRKIQSLSARLAGLPVRANLGRMKGRLGGRGIMLSLMSVVGGVSPMLDLTTIPE